MAKKEFEFYQDVKIATWVRRQFTIEAESKEEALKMVERFKTEDIGSSDESHRIWNTEWQIEAWDEITVEKNGGCATIELYDAEDRELIGDNAFPEHSSVGVYREPIGYQLDFCDNEWPDDLHSFEVFRSREDALLYAEKKRFENISIVSIYEGDIEDPSFFSAWKRVFDKNEEVLVYDSQTRKLSPAIVEIETSVESIADLVGVYPVKDGFTNFADRSPVEAGRIFQYAQGKTCPSCGSRVCKEHQGGENRQYFCPSCGGDILWLYL